MKILKTLTAVLGGLFLSFLLPAGLSDRPFTGFDRPQHNKKEAKASSSANKFSRHALPSKSASSPEGQEGPEPQEQRQEAGEAQIYSIMLDTAAGPMIYYNQGDLRWADHLYGGEDPMKEYGCGPTVLAMLANSFTSTSITPDLAADWASANGYFAPQSGSYHSLIPEGLAAFGLQTESVAIPSPEAILERLSQGHLLVALMGKGALTQSGHFIIITQIAGNRQVYIADPNNYQNCWIPWSLDQLTAELKACYDSGGPLWAVLPGSSPDL